MNRFFKKAISFVTALGVSATLCANVSIAASTTSLSMTTVYSNKYPIAVGMSDSTLFITKGSTKKTIVKTELDEKERSYLSIPSDAKITMVTSSGNKVKVANTVGFDRMFDICSGYYYNTIPVEDMYYESRGPVIAVGNGEKYNVLLENGKFLNEKTMYDSVSYSGGLIAATTGKSTTFFTTTGTKVLTLENNKYGSVVCYSNVAKQIIFGKSNAKDNWKADYTVTDRSGNVIKTFKGLSWYDEFSYIKGKDEKTYLFRDGSNIYNGVNEYYDLTGKKVKESTVVGTYALVTNANDKGKFTVKNRNGSVLLSIDCKISSAYAAASGDYLYVATWDGLYVYNRVKGELIDKDLEHSYQSYLGSVEVTDGGKSAILGLGKRVENDWGRYMESEGHVVYTLSTKKLSEKYDYITPLYSDSPSSNNIAYLTKQNEKYGLLNSGGNVTLKPKYSSFYYVDANVALMDNGKNSKVIISPQTGKKIPSTKDKTKAATVIPAECIIHKNDSHYYDYAPRSIQSLGKKYYRIITSDSKGKKFGLVILKYK
ncbi:MAG: hypothetical protein NC452_08235 [Eubacterium sp.]|nr:hypothetical protein [Eubacterium sp.]